jgi:hypothetical protein
VTVLPDLARLLKGWDHLVEVVRMDTHRRGHRGDRDTGIGADQLQRLPGTRAGALAPPPFTFRGRLRSRR